MSAKVREDLDGSLWIPRPDRETEAMLDALHPRAYPGALRWIPREVTERDRLMRVLLDRMKAKDPDLIAWLEANDPGMLICWRDKVCATCPHQQAIWARGVVEQNENILEILI